MAFEAKKIILYIRKSLMLLIRTSYSLACNHLFAFGMVFFLVILYRYFPMLFAFLVSSSPVIICTALLLGTLLIYGEPNITHNQEKDKKIEQTSSLGIGGVSHNCVVKNDENFTIKTRTVRRSKLKENLEKQVGKGRATGGGMIQRDLHDALSTSSSLVDEEKKKVHGEKREVNKDRDVPVQGFAQNKDLSMGNKDEDAEQVDKNDKLKVEIDKPASENHFGSSLGSKWLPIDHHDASSGSESEEVESSSPEASEAEIIPMLDELHPLLDSEAPQPVLRSTENSDAGSDRQSDDGSIDEEVENQEEEEDDDEAQEEKDYSNEAVVKWTADDQKNLMDLGTSELERNQRLENLIAKRRARKFLSFHAEKNLIDLDANIPAPKMEELSRFHFQIPSICAPRRNPFDIPYGSEENMSLPPIPGSAPSVLQPRNNPFDLPYDQVEESGNITRDTMNHEEYLSVAQRNIYYQSHENFTPGTSFSGDLKPVTDGSNLRPYFVAEGMDPEGTNVVTLQTQSSEKTDSKLGSANDSDTSSSIMDQEDHKELVEQEMHRESDLVPAVICYPGPIDHNSQSSEEVDSVDIDCEHSAFTEGADHAITLNSSTVTEEIPLATNAFGAVEMEIRQDEFDSPDSDGGILEVIEERYADSSSSSSDAYETNSKINIHEESGTIVQIRDDTNNPSDITRSISTDSNLLHKELERVDDSQVADPVYDSSPSAIEKTSSNISMLDETLFSTGKEDFSSSNSLASDVQVDSSEVCSPPRPLEKRLNSEEKDFQSVNGSMGDDFSSATEGIWIAPPSLSFVDQNESIAGAVSEITEHDVIHTELSQIHFGCPIKPVMPEILFSPRLSKGNSHAGGYVMTDTESSFLQLAEDGLGEPQFSISRLPSIPEQLEDFINEGEHDSKESPEVDARHLHPEIARVPSVKESGPDFEKSVAREMLSSFEQSDR